MSHRPSPSVTSSSVHSPHDENETAITRPPGNLLYAQYGIYNESNGETTKTIVTKEWKGQGRAGHGRNGRTGRKGGRNRMEGGTLYMHYKSGSINLSLLSPTFSPHLTTTQRDAHTHKHPTSRNQPDRERERRDWRAGPQRKQASKHLGNGVLSISIQTQGGGERGPGAADENHTHTHTLPRLAFCFYCHLIQFIRATSFLWSFFSFSSCSLLILSYPKLSCFIHCPRAVAPYFLRIGHRIEEGENQGDTCCCLPAGWIYTRRRAGTRNE